MEIAQSNLISKRTKYLLPQHIAVFYENRIKVKSRITKIKGRFKMIELKMYVMHMEMKSHYDTLI